MGLPGTAGLRALGGRGLAPPPGPDPFHRLPLPGRGARVADQAGVEDAGRKHRKVGVRSPAGAMGDAYRRAWPGVAEVLRALPEPQAGQTGLAACLGGPVAAVDLFDRPDPWPPRGRGCSPATSWTPWARAPTPWRRAPRRCAPAPRAPRPPRPRRRARSWPRPLGRRPPPTPGWDGGRRGAHHGGPGRERPGWCGRRAWFTRPCSGRPPDGPGAGREGTAGRPGSLLDRLNRLDRRAHLGGIGSADRFEGP